MEITHVLGFAVSPLNRVALIIKARPQWQRGMLNGVGGKVEHGEGVSAAMAREWKEETGGPELTWYWVATVSEKSDRADKQTFAVLCAKITDDQLRDLKAPGNEPVYVCRVSELPPNALPNLRWMIPMVMDEGVLDVIVDYNRARMGGRR